MMVRFRGFVSYYGFYITRLHIYALPPLTLPDVHML